MQKIRVVVESWDDLHLARGEEVPAVAGPPARLSLNGKAVELDLTAAHHAELERLLAPWLEAGHKPEKAPAVRADANGVSPMAAARRYNKEMAGWAATQRKPDGSPRYNITLGYKNKPYYPERLRQDYAAHLAAQAGSGGE